MNPGTQERYKKYVIANYTRYPVCLVRGEGSWVWDDEGKRYLDFFPGWGCGLLGHCPARVVEAVQKQVARSTHPGGCHELEIEWGRWVQRLMPSAEKIRFVSSGTEATLMALRLSRLFTGRSKVLKFAGHFHGWHDYLVPAADPPYTATTIPGIS